MSLKTSQKIGLFLVLLLDYLSVGVLIPLVPFLRFETSLFSNIEFFQNLLLGLLLASYPFFQFLASPLLGRWADNWGRKKVLLVCLIGTALGFIAMAWGILKNWLILVFAGRIIDGITGGNASIVFSYWASSDSEEERTQNFTLGGIALGLGFILGPVIAGVLSEPDTQGFFNLATPLFFIAILSVLLAIYLNRTLKERSLPAKEFWTPSPSTLLSILRHYLLGSKLAPLFLGLFLVQFGWTFFTHFLTIVLYQKFNISSSFEMGMLFAYLGITSILSQFLIVRRVSLKKHSLFWLRFSLLSSSLLIFVLWYLNNKTAVWFVFSFLGASFGFFSPNFSRYLTEKSPKQKLGEIFGVRQSIISLSQIVPPIIAGLGLNLDYNFPLLTSLLLLSLAFGYFIGIEKRVNNG